MEVYWNFEYTVGQDTVSTLEGSEKGSFFCCVVERNVHSVATVNVQSDIWLITRSVSYESLYSF